MFADWGHCFQELFLQGLCSHDSLQLGLLWDSGYTADPRDPTPGTPLTNQCPRRPLKFEFSPHGLSPLWYPRTQQLKASRPLAKVPDTGSIRARIQTQDSTTPAVSSAPTPTPTQAVRKHSGGTGTDASSGQLFSSEAWPGSVPTPARH